MCHFESGTYTGKKYKTQIIIAAKINVYEEIGIIEIKIKKKEL